MENQVTTNPNALALFFTEDVFVVADKSLPVEQLETETEKQEVIYNDTADIDPQVKEPEQIISFDFLGKNKRNILIMVADKDNEVSTETGNALLKKIIKASKIGKDDFAIVNVLKQEDCNFSTLNIFFKPRIIMAFGVTIETLGIQESAKQADVIDGVQLILSVNLDSLETNAAEKATLWNNLQTFSF